MLNIKIKALLFVPMLALMSCTSTISEPKKGLSKWLLEVNEFYTKSGIYNPITVNGAKYAYITGDGAISAGSIVGTIWYYVDYNFSAPTAESNFITCLFYDCSTGAVKEQDSMTSYQYACSLIMNGSLSGQIGYL